MGFTWATREEAVAEVRSVEVDRFIAQRYAARAMQEAARRNREGDFAGAAAALQGVARRVREYAGKDAELQEVAQKLDDEAQAYQAPVTEHKRKADFAASQAMTSSRDQMGQRARWKA
jgi:hypothetical protein